jgi:hypothetical protein
MRSIESSSAAVSVNFIAAAASDAWDGFDAPGIATTVSPQKLTSQLRATWLGVAAWADATLLSSATRGAVLLIFSGRIEPDIRRNLLTDSMALGSSWKRHERIPCARGD